MKRQFQSAAALILLSMISLPATAADSVNCGNKIVAKGDSTGKVIKACGQPDRIVPIHNSQGATIGERWEYYKQNKTIAIIISASKVARIEQITG